MNVLKDIVEIPVYATNDLTLEDFFGDKIGEIKAQYPNAAYNTAEQIVKISDYNNIAKLYRIEQYELKDDEFIMLCDFDSMEELKYKVLKDGCTSEIAGKKYKSKYNECKSGFIEMSTNHTNTGIILVPDNCNLIDDMKDEYLLVANYNAETEAEKQEIDKIFLSNSDSTLMQNLEKKEIDIADSQRYF